MKEIITILIIALCVIPLTGCFTQEIVDNEFTYEQYSLGDRIGSIQVSLPPGERRGTQVRVNIYPPTHNVMGTYTRIFYNETVDVFINRYLDEKGPYRIEYETDDFTANRYFFVGETPENVAFEVQSCTINNKRLEINIKNIGREAGKLYIVVVGEGKTKTAGVNHYNREYGRDTTIIRNGYDYTYSTYVGPGNLKVFLNEVVYSIEE